MKINVFQDIKIGWKILRQTLKFDISIFEVTKY